MNTSPASGTTNNAAGRDSAWIAYVLHGIGYLTAMMWPALIGVIINYVKRDDARGGTVNSHHQWLIRTFWFGLLWYLLSLAVIFWSAWPVLQSVLRAASAQNSYVIGWDTIFAVAGAAALGGLGFLLTWLWLLYRVIRGMINLANAKAVP
jgi:uncharacterized membrane protein